MFKKVIIGLVVFLVLFLGYVSTRPGVFHYERSAVINAPADKIFPYLSTFSLCEQWSPFDKPGMMTKRVITGTDGQEGAAMEFESKDSGSGKLTVLKIVPNELVQINLAMSAPFNADNLIEYKLKPEAEGTRFTWTMTGDGGFMSKLISVFIDCEKMIGGQFEEGIANLKRVVEAK